MNCVALVVEDEALIAEIYRTALTKVADKVFVANDLTSAMNVIREQETIHIVTLDLYLPNSTTDEVLNSISMIHARHPNCAVVILTGDESETMRRDAARYPADAFVLKNDVATMPLLLNVIIKALARRVSGNPEMVARLDGLMAKMAQLKP